MNITFNTCIDFNKFIALSKTSNILIKVSHKVSCLHIFNDYMRTPDAPQFIGGSVT
uniref:Uncharacterized protein n=1 Tax=uncultured Methanosarcinales archaeon TaxID=183757 RepID=A0A7H1KNP9_9EURY|nr:hypothetical protein HCAOCCDF_00011 [uncultured Methanosarcinales archaeon]